MKRKDPLAMGTSRGPDKHPHMHTQSNNSTTHTRPQAMRAVLHEHTHYISLEVRQKSKGLTRQVRGIQRLEAAEGRG